MGLAIVVVLECVTHLLVSPGHTDAAMIPLAHPLDVSVVDLAAKFHALGREQHGPNVLLLRKIALEGLREYTTVEVRAHEVGKFDVGEGDVNVLLGLHLGLCLREGLGSKYRLEISGLRCVLGCVRFLRRQTLSPGGLQVIEREVLVDV